MPLELNGTTGVQGNSGAFVAGTVVIPVGTSVDFTGIPSWVKRITVMLNAVSTNGSSKLIIQLGNSGGFVTSGYGSSAAGNGTAGNSTTGFPCEATDSAPSMSRCGFVSIVNFGASDVWVASGSMGRNDGANAYAIGGVVVSPSTVRVRITTVNGTDTFDAGSINILYE